MTDHETIATALQMSQTERLVTLANGVLRLARDLQEFSTLFQEEYDKITAVTPKRNYAKDAKRLGLRVVSGGRKP